MLDHNRLRRDLELLRSLARSEQSLLSDYVLQFCTKWVARLQETEKVLDDLPAMLTPNPAISKPLDMAGLPLDAGKGKADSR